MLLTEEQEREIERKHKYNYREKACLTGLAYSIEKLARMTTDYLSCFDEKNKEDNIGIIPIIDIFEILINPITIYLEAGGCQQRDDESAEPLDK